MILQPYLGADNQLSYLVGFPETRQCLLVDPSRAHADQVRADMEAHALGRPLVLWTAARASLRQSPSGPVHIWAEPRDGDHQLVSLGSQRIQLVPGGVGLDVELFGTQSVGRFGFLQLSHLPLSLRVLPLPETDGLAYLLGDLLFSGRPLLADRRGQGTPERLLELPGATRIHAGRALLGEYAATVTQERQRALGRLSLELR
jgi:hypothetical protein